MLGAKMNECRGGVRVRWLVHPIVVWERYAIRRGCCWSLSSSQGDVMAIVAFGGVGVVLRIWSTIQVPPLTFDIPPTTKV